MIVSDNYKFGFVHIPKCAGSSVRRDLAAYDDRNNYYWGRKKTKSGEYISYSHLTLALLRKYFPAELATISHYRTFALIRDPYQRFPSSFAQYLQSSEKRPLAALSKKELKDELTRLIETLSVAAELNPYLVYFTQQVDYIRLDGVQFVDHVYKIEDINLLYKDIEKIIGMQLSEEKGGNQKTLENVNMVYRSDILRRFAGKLSPYIPNKNKKYAKEKFYNFLFSKREGKFSDVFQSNYVKNFVSDYYGSDIDFFNQNNK